MFSKFTGYPIEKYVGWTDMSYKTYNSGEFNSEIRFENKWKFTEKRGKLNSPIYEIQKAIDKDVLLIRAHTPNFKNLW